MNIKEQPAYSCNDCGSPVCSFDHYCNPKKIWKTARHQKILMKQKKNEKKTS